MQNRETIPAVLANAAQILQSNPVNAEEALRHFLETSPGHIEARLLLTVALRMMGKSIEALAIIRALATERPEWAVIHFELGNTLTATGDGQDAITALVRASTLNPTLPGVWRALGDEYFRMGDIDAADKAYERHVEAARNDPLVCRTVTALKNGRMDIAEAAARERLKFHSTDIVAMRLLADVCRHTGRDDEAEALLAECTTRAPGYNVAQYEYAALLCNRNKAEEAVPRAIALLKKYPHNLNYLNLKATALGRSGEYEQAIACLEEILKDHPRAISVLLHYGHLLRVIGQRADAITAYRNCIAVDASYGEAYWALANMKTYKFTAQDVETMQVMAKHGNLRQDARVHLRFALGRALDDAEQYEEAFQNYAAGNALQRARVPYDADNTTQVVRRSIAQFTQNFFAAREGAGSRATDPIFIIGMPRSGSTLIEQVLASHSNVEGTAELTEIMMLAGKIVGSRGDTAYPDAIAPLDAHKLTELGENFLAHTRVLRKTDRPFFIDKMPNNFLHVGLIHLILPNAKIIDVRRHPMACGFSNFTQLFANGQGFSYRLSDMGRIYHDYVELMAHYDTVLPGRVHRIFYEALIANPETEVRRLLDYCSLPFEVACLRPHENTRVVLTPSSEQVRQPLSAEASDHWRRYEPWLGQLKTALGSVLDTYPDVPKFQAGSD